MEERNGFGEEAVAEEGSKERVVEEKVWLLMVAEDEEE